MYFTLQEKQAIANLALQMMLADGQVQDAETLLTFPIFAKIGIGEHDLDNVYDMNPIMVYATINGMNDKQKRFVTAFLGTIILADRDIDDKEVKTWQLTTAMCDLPSMCLSDAPAELKKILENWD